MSVQSVCTCLDYKKSRCKASFHDCICHLNSDNCRAESYYHETQCVFRKNKNKNKCKGHISECICTCHFYFIGKNTYPCCLLTKNKPENVGFPIPNCHCICEFVKSTSKGDVSGVEYCNSNNHYCICDTPYYKLCKSNEHFKCSCSIGGLDSCRAKYKHNCSCIEWGPKTCRLRDSIDNRHKSICVIYGKYNPNIGCKFIIPYASEIYRCDTGHRQCRTHFPLLYFMKKLWNQEPELVRLILKFVLSYKSFLRITLPSKNETPLII